MQDFFSIALDEYKVEDIAAFCGPQDAYLDLMQDFFSASIVMRENEIRVMPKRPGNEGADYTGYSKAFCID